MPHARIVAESLERARLLARQLEQRGYTVEIVAPGAPLSTPADLEITATATTRLPQDEVFAAPGSVLGLLDYEPQERPATEYYVLDETPPAGGSSIRQVVGQARQGMAEGWNAIAAGLAGRWARYRSARAQRRADAERVRAQQAEAARLARAAAERERRRADAQRAQAERLARIAAEEQVRRDAENAAAARLAEIAAEKQRARIRAIELERERALHASRAAAEQQKLQRQAGEELRRREAAAAAAAEQRRQRERTRLAALQHPAQPQAALRPQERRWQAALAAAAGVSALLVLGLFYLVERRPAAPVSNQVIVGSDAVEQEVPFGAASTLPAETMLQKASAPQPSQTDAPKPRPAPRRAFRVDSDASAHEPEVVIRRYPRRKPPSETQSSQVRRISDEEIEAEEELE